jgi:hypothetical protein
MIDFTLSSLISFLNIFSRILIELLVFSLGHLHVDSIGNAFGSLSYGLYKVNEFCQRLLCDCIGLDNFGTGALRFVH